SYGGRLKNLVGGVVKVAGPVGPGDRVLGECGFSEIWHHHRRRHRGRPLQKFPFVHFRASVLIADDCKRTTNLSHPLRRHMLKRTSPIRDTLTLCNHPASSSPA